MQVFTENHLKISVLISLGNSSGSGFFIRTDKKVYLVTAKHVLQRDDGTIRALEIEIIYQSINPEIKINGRLRVNLAATKPTFHKTADVALVEIGVVKTTSGIKEFKVLEDIEILERSYIKPTIVPATGLKLLSDVVIAADIYVFGYPTSLGLETAKQFDSSKPLLRKGIVANVHFPAKTIILDCPVYGGNSGGPVVQFFKEGENSYAYIIGVVSQYIPYVQKWRNDRESIVHTEHLNSGYSVASSMDSVLELLEPENGS